MKLIVKCVAVTALIASVGPSWAQQRDWPKASVDPQPISGPVAPEMAARKTPASRPATADEIVRIAFMDPLSGSFANVGQNFLKSWQFAAERFSGSGNPAGVRFEVVGFDNKGSPQESLNTLKAAVDQGFRYVVQGNGSGAGLAILEAVAKHNDRNPGKEVVYLNYAAVDPTMTNERCDYWHFRLDADTSMKMEALTTFMQDQAGVTKVYLLNQDYSHGQQVARYFKEGIARKRPDVKIVGEDLHPIGQVKDFTPYVAKIKQSGADAIVTGNWGQDLTLLVKALNDSGLRVPLYTYYAGNPGTPAVLPVAGGSDVYVVAYGHSNPAGELGQMVLEFEKRYRENYYAYASYNGIRLLGAAMAKARSIGSVPVARALEGLQISSFAGDVTMRASDHQLQQAIYIAKWQKADAAYPHSVENSGYTFAPVRLLGTSATATPTTCRMKRPLSSP